MDYQRNVGIYLGVERNKQHEAIPAASERARNLGKILGHWVSVLGQGGRGDGVGAGGRGHPLPLGRNWVRVIETSA